MAAILIVQCHESDRQSIADAFHSGSGDGGQLKEGDVIFMPPGVTLYVAKFGDGEGIEVRPLSETVGTVIQDGYRLAIENQQLKVIRDYDSDS